MTFFLITTKILKLKKKNEQNGSEIKYYIQYQSFRFLKQLMNVFGI